MDQIKIGKFIAARRKAAGLTQLQLAEKLGITDRAVSKWETGRALPDSSVMLALCALLDITVNDLLSGEVVSMENYNKEMEKNLLEAVRQKEQTDKRMLNLEIAIGVTSVLAFFALVLVASLAEMAEPLRLCLIVAATVLLTVILLFLLRIEQVAGYYECQKCGHRYVPTYKSVLLAPHVNRTRYMRCPACGEKSWQKKVVRKEKDEQ